MAKPSAQTVEGLWGLAPNTCSIPGQLILTEDDGLELLLRGHVAGADILEVMFGRDAEGRDWTLHGARRGNISLGGKAAQKFHVISAHQGLADPALRNRPVRQLRLKFPGLNFLARRAAAPVELERGASCSYSPSEEEILVDFDPPRPLANMAAYGLWLSLGLTVLADRSCLASRVRFQMEDGSVVEPLQQPNRPFRPIHQIWRAAPQLLGVCAKSWETWKKAPRAAECVQSFYDGTHYLTEKFVLLASACEVYHRAFRGSGAIARAAWKAEIARITSYLPESDRGRVAGCLAGKNEASFAQRVFELSAMLPLDEGGRRAFANGVRDTRNDLLHAEGTPVVGAEPFRRLQHLVNRCRTLVMAVMLSHIGVSEEAVKSYVAEMWDTYSIWVLPDAAPQPADPSPAPAPGQVTS